MCKQLSDLGKIYMGGNAIAPLLKAYMPYGQLDMGAFGSNLRVIFF